MDSSSSSPTPTMPKEYTAVMLMKLPYIDLEVPLRVSTSAGAQKIESYDGVQVEHNSPEGVYKYVFNNSRRVCMFSKPQDGPTVFAEEWKAEPFLPDLSKFKRADDEVVRGFTCQKW